MSERWFSESERRRTSTGVNGVAGVQVGEPVRLLEAQAERGFANVPEKALEALLLMMLGYMDKLLCMRIFPG